MPWRRRILLALCILSVGGSLTASLGYALYIRSSGYRQTVSRDVAALLGLPTEIGAVEPLSSSSRAFRSVEIWLPEQKSQIFACDRAVWRADGSGSDAVNFLDLSTGWLLLGTGEFSGDDYRQMLRGSLGVDFADLHLKRIQMEQMDIVWRQPDFELRVAAAAGDVHFDDDGMGRANLSARDLNGTAVLEPIAIRALFTPGEGLEIHHVALEVPRIPLAALELDALAGTALRAGSFEGTIAYRQVQTEQVITLRGAVRDARLAELTQRVIGGPFSGAVDVEIDEATLAASGLQSLILRGSLSGVQLRAFAPLMGASDLDGAFDLQIHQARYIAGHLEHLSVSADAADVPLAVVTRLLGRGVITGQLRITVNSLLIVDDTIRWADIDLEVVPPEGAAGTIDREAIRFAAEQALGIELGSVADYLPETVEYARMGCKLLIDRSGLTVRGSHGAGGDAILTVRVLGREFGVLDAPDRIYPVADLLETVRQSVADYDIQQFLNWWKTKHASPGE